MPIFIPSLKRDGHLDDIKITIFIVGSRKLEGEDYASIGWNLLAPNINIYGFDADPEACKQMNTELETRQVNWHEKHIPLALWNRSGKFTLYVTKYPACSSLYPPSQSYIYRSFCG